ncbi:hypothetical protein TWF730_009188 [Orbilia blumenaviensis]|uniref:tyrosinase n=1 Tax=Orbilia blumenaviensis TaxID=1796055 RepID=A0AAV9V0T6_9PEZI
MSEPTWDDDILPKIFTTPFWISPPEAAQKKAQWWLKAMIPFLITLTDYNSVCEWADTIYYHMASGNMPLGDDPFPDDACEMFRVWVNQGMRQRTTDPIASRVIPLPNTRLDPDAGIPKTTVRKDILSLTEDELNHYRMQVDDILKAGQVIDGNDITLWQKIGYLHCNWCLHYQEGFLPWHRANLLYVENLIGCRIPYWNWYAAESSDPNSPSSGIPQAFLDETYIHPKTGESRPNPLKYACSKDGVSKSTNLQPSIQYIQRFPCLNDPQKYPGEYAKWVAYFTTFHEQTSKALGTSRFSVPQGNGYPWANIPGFDIPMDDSEYNRDPTALTFDNLFEQAHDNYHGFIGPDMSDNSYTAFDPVFYSLHANVDRVFEMFLKANPTSQFSSNVPLEPFKGPLATTLAEGNPLKSVYTTLGDMVKPSKSLGYTFGEPVYQDYGATPLASKHMGAKASLQPDLYVTANTWVAATSALADKNNDQLKAIIEFDGVRCTNASYTIDVFISDSEGFAPPEGQVDTSQKEYVGRMTRINMGEGTDKGRCVKKGVKRMMFVDPAKLEGFQRENIKVYQVVRDMDQGTVVPKEVYEKLPGFVAKIVWGIPS